LLKRHESFGVDPFRDFVIRDVMAYFLKDANALIGQDARIVADYGVQFFSCFFTSLHPVTGFKKH